MARQLVQSKTTGFVIYGCSVCNWVFKPSGTVVGKSLEEMKANYEAQRDKEFSAHVCLNHPRLPK